MEAVCYFCLCSISRLKKSNNSSISNASSSSTATVNTSKTAIDLLRDTLELLRYLSEKLVKPLMNEQNEILVRKFRILT